MKDSHNPPSASVIIAVYNHFEWLQLILDALRMQTEKNFEVIIADDGSNKDTVEKINRYMANHPDLRMRHSWQEDEGWRKNKSLNKAVRLAESDYLIFV
ncbi:MAG: glycosyltransferase, partial [Muribaculaceae bacterium]|nr:glycosyltransferase [Muribaculaceae bacterium]